MAVYKDNATGTWRVIYRFTNWKGERKQTQKRGFATKREAQAWEHEAILKQGTKLDMTFGSFFEVYEADKKQRVNDNQPCVLMLFYEALQFSVQSLVQCLCLRCKK